MSESDDRVTMAGIKVPEWDGTDDTWANFRFQFRLAAMQAKCLGVLDGEETIETALATSWLGDKDKVRQMLHEFEWLIKQAVDTAQVDPLEKTLDPRRVRKALIREEAKPVERRESGGGCGAVRSAPSYSMHELPEEEERTSALPPLHDMAASTGEEENVSRDAAPASSLPQPLEVGKLVSHRL